VNKSVPPAPIRIDYRERSAEYLEFLQLSTPISIEVLPSADIVIDNLGIERKTVADFFSTLKEGRLWPQIFKLKESYPRQLLLIEGHGMRHHLDVEETMGIYIRICVGWQIPILHTRDGAHTAKIIRSMLHQDTYASAGVAKRRPRRGVNFHPALEVLKSIPGIGEDRAVDLLRSFGTVGDVFKASLKELLQVKGVGKIQARRILEIGQGTAFSNPVK
jgi:DNA excision repair protein ERCC-4